MGNPNLRPPHLVVRWSDELTLCRKSSRAAIIHADSSNWKSQRSPLTLMSESDGTVDVSDLGLTMEDLKAPLPETTTGSTLASSGYESTSGVPDNADQGCAWIETSESIEATLTIPGLRGQPSAAMAIDLTPTTATVTVFGQAVWSCVLRGEIEVSKSSAEASDGEGMLPVLRVTAAKRADAPRWGGFIRSIGVDSILQ